VRVIHLVNKLLKVSYSRKGKLPSGKTPSGNFVDHRGNYTTLLRYATSVSSTPLEEVHSTTIEPMMESPTSPTLLIQPDTSEPLSQATTVESLS
jgi:hypothetical protein